MLNQIVSCGCKSFIRFDLKFIILFFVCVLFVFDSVITHIFFVSVLFHGWPDLWTAFFSANLIVNVILSQAHRVPRTVPSENSLVISELNTQKLKNTLYTSGNSLICLFCMLDGYWIRVTPTYSIQNLINYNLPIFYLPSISRLWVHNLYDR